MANRFQPYLDAIMNPGGIDVYLKRGTLDFMETAYNQNDATIIQTLIGASYSNAVVYILYGCVQTIAGGNTTISAGAMFYNGEIYLTTGFPTSATPANITANLGLTSWQPVNAIGETYADPQEFVGTGNANIHYYRTVILNSGTSGSGTLSGNTASDFGNIVNYGSWIPISGLTITATGGGTATVYSQAYNRYKILDNKTIHWQFQGSFSLSGTVSLISVTPNPTLPIIFNNVSGNLLCGLFDSGNPLCASLLGTDSIELFPMNGFTFESSGNHLFDFNIIAEIK